MTSSFHREMPSAMELSTPATRDASKHHPLPTSKHPNKRMSAPDRGSLPPRHFETQCTADKLSPRIKIVPHA